MNRRLVSAAALAAVLASTAVATPAFADGTKVSSTPFQSHHQWQTNWDNLVQRGSEAGVQWQCNGALCDMTFIAKDGVKAHLMTREHGRGYCYIVSGESTADCYREDGKKTVWTLPQDEAPAPHYDPYAPPTEVANAPAAPLSPDSIRLQCSIAGGGCHLRVDLGDATAADMILDTGATSMVVTRQWATALVNEGAATWGQPGEVTLADNSTRSEDRIIIKRVSVGNRVAYNVYAGVKKSGDMLLGLVPLNDMGKFAIDARTGQLNFLS